jgi:hypothetical protein
MMNILEGWESSFVFQKDAFSVHQRRSHKGAGFSTNFQKSRALRLLLDLASPILTQRPLAFGGD